MHAQDIVVALAIRLVKPPQPSWNYPLLSAFTSLSVSQCHVACRGLMEARLMRQDDGEPWSVSARNLAEFMVHGLPYWLPAKVGPTTRGIPTGRSAAFVAAELGEIADGEVTVWPWRDGTVRGNAVSPIHACQLRCCEKPGAERLHQALVLADLIRIGGDKDRSWAKDRLAALLKQPPA